MTHVWKALVQANDGNTYEREVVSGWDPSKVTTDEIARVAAIEARVEAKKQLEFAPISAELIS